MRPEPYYIGTRLVEDDSEGMPVLAEDGTEIYIRPSEFKTQGMPVSEDAGHAPVNTDKVKSI